LFTGFGKNRAKLR